MIGTFKLGIRYLKENISFDLIGFFYVYYVGCKVFIKSVSITYKFFGHSLVSLSSKKQNFVALSTAEYEYIAIGTCVIEVLITKAIDSQTWPPCIYQSYHLSQLSANCITNNQL